MRPSAIPVAPSPYQAPELYDQLFESLDFDRAFWLEVGRGCHGPVLDLGCGTGRVLVPLLEAGVDADGVDLEPGGALVLHMSYPGASLWLGAGGEPVLEHEATIPASGTRLQLYDRRFTDAVNQHQRSEIEVRELDAGGSIVASHRFEARQRWVYLYELELLLRLAGFSRWQVHGDFEGGPLERDDQQMIAWAWREPA